MGTYVVTDYGADPTGASDATAAVQTAVDAAEAANGGVVWFPAGTYLMDGRIVCGTSNVAFLGEGVASTLRKSATARDRRILQFTKAGATIRGIEIGYLGFVSDRATPVADVALVDFASGDGNLADIEVHHCRWEMPRDHSVAIMFACKATTTIENVRVRDNAFDGVPYAAIAVNNSFSASYLINGVEVARNLIRNPGSFGITCAGPMRALTIAGNYLDASSARYGIEIVGPQGCVIAGNKLRGTFAVAAIGSSASASNPVGQDILIEGNITVGEITGGFVFQSMTRCLIANNQWAYSGTIAFSGVNHGCDVSLVDNWLEATTPYTTVNGARVLDRGNRTGAAVPLTNPFRGFVDQAGTTSSATVTVGSQMSSWRVVSLRVRCIGVAGDGSGGGHAERIVTMRFVSGRTGVIVTNTAIVETGLSLAVAMGTNQAVITATGASGIRCYWDIDYLDGSRSAGTGSGAGVIASITLG